MRYFIIINLDINILTPLIISILFYPAKSSSLIETDKNTGLMKARHGTHMMTADGSIRSVPADCFVHPQTGHCLPIAGNVAFDPVTSRLVFVTDSATSKCDFLQQQVTLTIFCKNFVKIALKYI